MADNTEILNAALALARQGLRVIPLYGLWEGRCTCREGARCPTPGKHPVLREWPKKATTDEATIRGWFNGKPRNVGIATGAESGVFVVDVDGSEGLATLRRLEAQHGPLPPTVTTLTGSGEGLHYWFQHPGGKIRNRGREGEEEFLPGLHVRGDGGQVVVPPSKHASGREYAWETTGDPADVEVAEAPEWLLKLVQGSSRKPAVASAKASRGTTAYGEAALLAECACLAQTPKGDRNNELNRVAYKLGQLIGGGELDEGQAREAIRRAGEANGMIAEDGLPAFAASLESGLTAGKKEPRSVAAATGVPEREQADAADDTEAARLLARPTTDAGNAELLADLFGADLRFDWARMRWLKWAEHLWVPATAGDLALLAKRSARARYSAAGLLRKKQHSRWGFASEAKARIDAAVALARGEPPISDSGNGWDAADMLLGCPNGVVELDTGEFRPGRREDRLTLEVAVPYDPKAQCPRWRELIAEIFCDDAALAEFFWRAIGYSITGSTKEQVFFLPHGPGGCGRNTLFDTLRQALGALSYEAPFSLFDHECRSHHAQSLAQLEGRRLVVAIEPSEGCRLNEGRLKTLAGNQYVTANLMYHNDRTFRNVTKAWLIVNQKPKVQDDTDGFWRKALLIPFTQQWLHPERLATDPALAALPWVRVADLDLPTKLKSELPGILRWAVEGAVRWANSGLRVPKSIYEASNVWREEADPLAAFYECCCITGPSHKVRAGDLYAAYLRFCEERKVRERDIMTQTAFGLRVGSRYERKPRLHVDGVQGPAYLGIGLLSPHAGGGQAQ